MSRQIFIASAAVSTWVGLAVPGFSALIVNPPLPITQQVTVQPIIVSDSNGSNTAEFLGNATQQATIEGFVDTIWAQAGIDVEWLAPNYWNNTTANSGNYSLTSLLGNGASAGVSHTDPLVLNFYFVEITPGSTDLGENSVNGLAYVGSNGISQAVGDNLVGFPSGQEIVAAVTAHEIGHNLGLGHIVDTENLMLASGDGQRINSSQIGMASASIYSVAYTPPTPGDFNEDGYVDNLDLLAWEGGFGTNSGASLGIGDADGDSDVDGNDFLIWQRSLAPPPTTLLAAVPEPSTLMLGGMLLLLTYARRR